jgi:hypothetical protein
MPETGGIEIAAGVIEDDGEAVPERGPQPGGNQLKRGEEPAQGAECCCHACMDGRNDRRTRAGSVAILIPVGYQCICCSAVLSLKRSCLGHFIAVMHKVDGDRGNPFCVHAFFHRTRSSSADRAPGFGFEKMSRIDNNVFSTGHGFLKQPFCAWPQFELECQRTYKRPKVSAHDARTSLAVSRAVR